VRAQRFPLVVQHKHVQPNRTAGRIVSIRTLGEKLSPAFACISVNRLQRGLYDPEDYARIVDHDWRSLPAEPL
jgi:hypothetical protein